MKDINNGHTAMMKNEFIINKEKGILIAYEGISGCGKSESIKKLFCYLSEKGYKATVMQWNSNSTIRKIVKKLHDKDILTPKIYSILQWISFLIDYFFKTVPLLKDEHIIIADRYIYTALTRDAANGANGLLNSFLYNLVRKEDLLLFYDIPPSVCYERIQTRRKKMFHTNKIILKNKLLKNRQLYYLKKLRREYVKLLSDPNICKASNVLILCDNNTDMNSRVEYYINKKLLGHEIKNIMEVDS